jgi:lipoteichoic acid synthase
MKTSAGTVDFERLVESGGEPSNNRSPDAGIRNVIIYVLESVGAKYVLDEKSSAISVPELMRYRHSAVSFRNIYAHVPASNNSLASIMTSAYPLISYKELTQEKPNVALESISSVLHARGYRTGFFSSGDARFQRGLEFLSHQAVDTLISYKDINCKRDRFSNSNDEWPFQDSYDDRCMLEAFMKWDGVSTAGPFFAMLWPVQTHHPYSVVGEQQNFGVKSEEFNRYLNALHQTDATFGELMRWLKARGRTDDTLVVVIGDHGEAFGQHNQWIHAYNIYDENVRVPLMLINPRLYHGTDESTVGGLVDIAPTIMEILGLASPGSWQGRSLFAPRRSGRAYFFSPYAQFLFGIRDGNLKLILNATNDTRQVYDIGNDPEESHNLAADMPDFVRSGEERMAAWVQYQVGFYDGLLKH